MSKIDLSRCKVVKEPLLTNQIVLFFRKNHILVEPIDNVIGAFKAAGLNDLWISKYVKKQKILVYEGPEAITFYDLSGTFNLFKVGILIACLAFVGELLHYHLHRAFAKSS